MEAVQHPATVSVCWFKLGVIVFFRERLYVSVCLSQRESGSFWTKGNFLPLPPNMRLFDPTGP